MLSTCTLNTNTTVLGNSWIHIGVTVNILSHIFQWEIPFFPSNIFHVWTIPLNTVVLFNSYNLHPWGWCEFLVLRWIYGSIQLETERNVSKVLCQYSAHLFRKVPWLILLSCLSLGLSVSWRFTNVFGRLSFWQLGTMVWHVFQPEYASFSHSQCNSNLCALGIHHLYNKSHLTDDSSCLWLHSSWGRVRGQNQLTSSFELKEGFGFNSSQVPSSFIKASVTCCQLP